MIQADCYNRNLLEGGALKIWINKQLVLENSLQELAFKALVRT